MSKNVNNDVSKDPPIPREGKCRILLIQATALSLKLFVVPRTRVSGISLDGIVAITSFYSRYEYNDQRSQ